MLIETLISYWVLGYYLLVISVVEVGRVPSYDVLKLLLKERLKFDFIWCGACYVGGLTFKLVSGFFTFSYVSIDAIPSFARFISISPGVKSFFSTRSRHGDYGRGAL